MAVEGSVPMPGIIVPHLVVRDTAEALQFYENAFSALVLYRSPSPSGQGEHIHMKVWDSLVQLSAEEPAQRGELAQGALLASPETLAGSTCVFQVVVPDVDEAYKRAVDHGAVPALPPTDMFWGDRYGWVQDPSGHVWAFSEVTEPGFACRRPVEEHQLP
jgi:PhnB protein